MSNRFFPLRLLELLLWKLGLHKGSFIHEWLPKTVFSRERLIPSLQLSSSSLDVHTVLFSHLCEVLQNSFNLFGQFAYPVLPKICTTETAALLLLATKWNNVARCAGQTEHPAGFLSAPLSAVRLWSRTLQCKYVHFHPLLI